MSDIKSLAFQRGMAMLTASGAIYAVYHNTTLHCSPMASFAMETPEGLVGTLEVVVRKKKQRAKGADRVNWGYTGYIDGLTTLEVGEVWSYQAKSKPEAQGLQRAATGKAGHLWGPGNFISSVNAQHVLEILRVV
jgi:hypothetical protein